MLAAASTHQHRRHCPRFPTVGNNSVCYLIQSAVSPQPHCLSSLCNSFPTQTVAFTHHLLPSLSCVCLQPSFPPLKFHPLLSTTKQHIKQTLNTARENSVTFQLFSSCVLHPVLQSSGHVPIYYWLLIYNLTFPFTKKIGAFWKEIA